MKEIFTNSIKVIVSICGLFLLVGINSGCQGGAQPNIELIQDMMESPAVKPQEKDELAPGQIGMRLPPEHTVPVGFKPYQYANDAEGAFKNLKNPMTGEMSEKDMMIGMKAYETHCALCHGPKGEGGVEAKSSIAEFMALKPPSLLTEKVKKMSDGQVYHIITMGQGVMGPYAVHVPQERRWQLVNYIRHLESKAK